MNPQDVERYRAMTIEQRHKRGFDFMEQPRRRKIASMHVHQPG
jgi:hypothetical protein